MPLEITLIAEFPWRKYRMCI